MSQKIRNLCMDRPTWLGRPDCVRCDVLHEALFSDLSDIELGNILSGTYEPVDQFSYEEGAVLYREGCEDNAVFTIRSGLVKLVRYLPDGRERIIRLNKTADSIGLERLHGRPYAHTAIAIQRLTACRVPLDVLKRLDTERPRFYRKLMERWASGLLQADDYIMMLLSGTVRQRVAHLIEWLSEITDSDDRSTVLLLNGKNTAAMLDITVESVSRTLADLKRRDILRHLEGDRYGFDARALREYASGD